MNETNPQNEESIIILAKEVKDFTKIAIAASEEDLTIEEIDADEQSISSALQLLRKNDIGVRAIKITFNDNNGTRQAFLDSLNTQIEAED